MKDTVGSFGAARRDELEALRDLGLPLLTTNYDDLLEEVTGGSARPRSRSRHCTIRASSGGSATGMAGWLKQGVQAAT